MDTRYLHRLRFIVRLWREPREIQGAPPEWRGSIEYVQRDSPRGEPHYFRDLNDIVHFIQGFLHKTEDSTQKDETVVTTPNEAIHPSPAQPSADLPRPNLEGVPRDQTNGRADEVTDPSGG